MSPRKTSLRVLRVLVGLAMVCSLVCLSYAMKANEKQSTTMNGKNGKKDIVATLRELPEGSKFLERVKKTEMVKELEGKGPFTVLVPINSAYDAMPEKLREKIKENPESERKLIRFHILKGDKNVTELKTVREHETFSENGEHVHFTKIITEKAHDIIEREIPCSNGRIYLIREVLVPEKLERKLMGHAERTKNGERAENGEYREHANRGEHAAKSTHENDTMKNGKNGEKPTETVKSSTPATNGTTSNGTTPQNGATRNGTTQSAETMNHENSNTSTSQPVTKTVPTQTTPAPATRPAN